MGLSCWLKPSPFQEENLGLDGSPAPPPAVGRLAVLLVLLSVAQLLRCTWQAALLYLCELQISSLSLFAHSLSCPSHLNL